MRPALEELALWLLVSLITTVFFFFPPTLNLLSVALTLTEGVRRYSAIPTGPEDSVEGLILSESDTGPGQWSCYSPKGACTRHCTVKVYKYLSPTPTLSVYCACDVTLWSQDLFYLYCTPPSYPSVVLGQHLMQHFYQQLS